MNDENLLQIEGAENAPVSAAMAVGAIALNMAMKWHDMTLIKDGVMYQQKKMEGTNIEYLEFHQVLETAKRIEVHLMGTSHRLAEMVVEALVDCSQDELDGENT